MLYTIMYFDGATKASLPTFYKSSFFSKQKAIRNAKKIKRVEFAKIVVLNIFNKIVYISE